MDTRYLISNSKDQTIKLWDMRRFADLPTVERCGKASARSNHRWDYRVGPQPQACKTKRVPYIGRLAHILFLSQCKQKMFLEIQV